MSCSVSELKWLQTFVIVYDAVEKACLFETFILWKQKYLCTNFDKSEIYLHTDATRTMIWTVLMVMLNIFVVI